MTKLSVIIVNYNVKYFLEQSLLSVRKAAENIDSNIIVVDNASTDGSVDMVRQKFPEVTLIENQTNIGFARANNQAITASNSQFVLLLNPDTVVEEDTLEKVLAFMEAHPEAGALGVKMIDGKGNFLPESKRSFPSPSVSFFKIFGLSRLFPRSAKFSRYHLGHLSRDEIHEVDVLAGAFMLIRREALMAVGLFDEAFFMYGEDIDLSYRLVKGGWKNYYFPDTSIIHYKGESTKKGSMNYVRLFYEAMIIFADKHFKESTAWFYKALIRMAIYLRALLSLIYRLLKAIGFPVIEGILFFGGIYLIKNFYAANVKEAATYYPEEFMYFVVPAYVLIWLLSIFFSGGYDRPWRIGNALRGVFVGTLLIAALYGFINESWRFSRAMILLGAAWAGIEVILSRSMVHLASRKNLDFDMDRPNNLVIVGQPDEAQRALNLLSQSGIEKHFVGFISASRVIDESIAYIGDLAELEDLVEVYGLQEIIFCAKDVRAASTISWMTRLGPGLDYKIVPENSGSIIGSNSKNSAGDLYAVDVNLSIAQPAQKRNKRVFDILFCLLIFPFLPILIFVVGFKLISHWLQVLAGLGSWVGYCPLSNKGGATLLPRIKKGILTPCDAFPDKQLNKATQERLNLLYAKDYRVAKDWTIIRKGWRSLR